MFEATIEDVLILDPIEFALDVRVDVLPDHGSRFVGRVPGQGDLGHSVGMGRIPGGTCGSMGTLYRGVCRSECQRRQTMQSKHIRVSPAYLETPRSVRIRSMILVDVQPKGVTAR